MGLLDSPEFQEEARREAQRDALRQSWQPRKEYLEGRRKVLQIRRKPQKPELTETRRELLEAAGELAARATGLIRPNRVWQVNGKGLGLLNKMASGRILAKGWALEFGKKEEPSKQAFELDLMTTGHLYVNRTPFPLTEENLNEPYTRMLGDRNTTFDADYLRPTKEQWLFDDQVVLRAVARFASRVDAAQNGQ